MKDEPLLTEDMGTSSAAVRGFQLTVVEGPEVGATLASAGDHASLGSHEGNDLVLSDPTVSRFHSEIQIDRRGARIRDLDSRNGTVVDGTRVVEAYLKSGSLIRLGRALLRFELEADVRPLRLSKEERFGSLVGHSIAMRAIFALLERAAATEATVLIEGETGTGKGAAAEAIHLASARRAAPFLVVDCTAIPGPLLESELFGHEKGAFTGADARRIGAFEEAAGGTIFLDEIGDLPAELQPKLLRVLESREVRRVGQNVHHKVDFRLIAATHRDLRADVNAGRFRADLYFRLAVLRIPMPPLREHLEDLPVIARGILAGLGARPEAAAALLTPELLDRITHGAWPGNARELRNYLERCLVLEEPLPVGEVAAPPATRVDPAQPYADARAAALAAFEREYVAGLLQLHRGNVSQAARACGLTRVHLYRLIERHGLRPIRD
jgi:DNA-binding NtrC family response regulator